MCNRAEETDRVNTLVHRQEARAPFFFRPFTSSLAPVSVHPPSNTQLAPLLVFPLCLPPSIPPSLRILRPGLIEMRLFGCSLLALNASWVVNSELFPREQRELAHKRWSAMMLISDGVYVLRVHAAGRHPQHQPPPEPPDGLFHLTNASRPFSRVPGLIPALSILKKLCSPQCFDHFVSSPFGAQSAVFASQFAKTDFCALALPPYVATSATPTRSRFYFTATAQAAR